MIPTAVLRVARAGFGLRPGSVRVLSTRFNKICLAHRASIGPRVQIRLLRDDAGSVERLTSEMQWLEHLACKHRLRVPAPLQWHRDTYVSPPIRNRDGTAWRAIACTWIAGAHLGRGWHISECGAVGTLLGQLHNANRDAPDGFAATRPIWGIPRLFELATTLRDLIAGTAQAPPGISDSFVARLRQSHDTLAAAWATLPVDDAHTGLIHTDAHWQNLRWQRRQPGLVDFEDFANGRFMLDVACMTSRFESQRGHATRLDALLDAYDRVRPLPSDAHRDLQVMLAFRRLDYAGWVLSWPRPDLHAWGPDALAGTPDYIDRTL